MAFNPNISVPVAILIFDNDGQITYRAYSPSQYNFNEEGSDHFGQFLARIYNRVSYNHNNPNNSNTYYGCLKEIHTRHLAIPINNRHDVCYFSTYNHPHTTYMPVHRQSPVFFDVNLANNYAETRHHLSHHRCEHEFV